MCPLTDGMENPAYIPDDQITAEGDYGEDTSPVDMRPSEGPGWIVATKDKDGNSPKATITLTPIDSSDEAPIVGKVVIDVSSTFL